MCTISLQQQRLLLYALRATDGFVVHCTICVRRRFGSKLFRSVHVIMKTIIYTSLNGAVRTTHARISSLLLLSLKNKSSIPRVGIYMKYWFRVWYRALRRGFQFVFSFFFFFLTGSWDRFDGYVEFLNSPRVARYHGNIAYYGVRTLYTRWWWAYYAALFVHILLSPTTTTTTTTTLSYCR